MVKLNRGVTLVELMIVVVIIAVLGSVALFSFRNQIFKGKDAKRKADIKRMSIALEEYEKDKNCYPATGTITCNPGNALSPYLEKIPCDPSSNLSYYYEAETAVCPRWYRLFSVLENDQDSVITTLKCDNGCGPSNMYNYYYGSTNAPTIGQ